MEQTRQKLRKRGKIAQVLQGPGFTDSEQFSHDSSQVVRGGGDQVAFADVHDFLQPTASHAAGVADVGERPLTTFAAKPLELATLGTLQAAAIGVHGSLQSRRFIGPS